jgi:D-xylose 1-dehydrogenase (NADP+, D-xylono-1,5-lactone-forming)
MTPSWGLLSTAKINEAILRAARPGSVVAVASRSPERAEAYARAHDIPRAHGSYYALLADDEVDAVYVSLPNGLHAEWALRALGAGKHVLCEKPFSGRAADVERCSDAADEFGLVLSEGFMWRHHPQADRLVELLRDGAIGELREVRAAFGFVLDRDDDPRWDPALAGGSLMDVGCYCVSAARLLAGEEPDAIQGEATATRNGVDAHFVATLGFPGGATGHLECAFDAPLMGLEAIGSGGRIVLRDPWHGGHPVLEVDGERVDVEQADPYERELADVEAAISDGRPPRLGRDDALGQARVLEVLLHG